MNAMSPLGEQIFAQAKAMNEATATTYDLGVAEGERRAAKKVARLEAALKPFVAAYVKASDPIGDSDLYGEQPVHVLVTLGDCRKAHAAMDYMPRKTGLERD